MSESWFTLWTFSSVLIFIHGTEIAIVLPLCSPSRTAWCSKLQKLVQKSTAPSVNRYCQMADAAMFAEVRLPSFPTLLSCVNPSLDLHASSPLRLPEVNTSGLLLPGSASISLPFLPGMNAFWPGYLSERIGLSAVEHLLCQFACIPLLWQGGRPTTG